MYIELVGLSGAGKTTIAKRVSELLSKEEVEHETRAPYFKEERSWVYKILRAIYLLKFINLFAVKLFLVKGDRASVLIRIRRLFMYLIARHHIALSERSPERVFLYDEGIVHWVLPALDQGNISKEDAIRFFETTALNNTLLIYIDIDPETAVNRKPEKLWAELATEEKVKKFKNRGSILRDFIKTLQGEQFEVKTFDGAAAPESIAREVAIFLERKIKRDKHYRS